MRRSATLTCTKTLLKQPPIQTDCTFLSSTITFSKFTDCGGCALTTRELGVGIPCEEKTTVRGIATATVDICSPSPTCTVTAIERIPFQNIADGTCTHYKSTHTVPRYTDCKGCALTTVNEGAGPVVKCSETVTSAATTITAPACSSTA
ncbi:hypothetical protein NA57DRAFT_52132 [Rhizodiscina lignyota]|uniref:Uncharacterized protein n=1 Tax=Rhizodiscina lignyota TaxID=1504668 RepID=A0A9P4M9A4_9PEZI|nr:hypothetical protein NA57DRAFT_52132 [Rhizodiscina lignyota]